MFIWKSFNTVFCRTNKHLLNKITYSLYFLRINARWDINELLQSGALNNDETSGIFVTWYYKYTTDATKKVIDFVGFWQCVVKSFEVTLKTSTYEYRIHNGEITTTGRREVQQCSKDRREGRFIRQIGSRWPEESLMAARAPQLQNNADCTLIFYHAFPPPLGFPLSNSLWHFLNQHFRCYTIIFDVQ